MVKETTAIKKCIKEIEDEAICSFDELDIGESQIFIKKPTKRKEYKAIIINLGKPSFQLFINERFVATYFYNISTKKWKKIE